MISVMITSLAVKQRAPGRSTRFQLDGAMGSVRHRASKFSLTRRHDKVVAGKLVAAINGSGSPSQQIRDRTNAKAGQSSDPWPWAGKNVQIHIQDQK